MIASYVNQLEPINMFVYNSQTLMRASYLEVPCESKNIFLGGVRIENFLYAVMKKKCIIIKLTLYKMLSVFYQLLNDKLSVKLEVVLVLGGPRLPESFHTFLRWEPK